MCRSRVELQQDKFTNVKRLSIMATASVAVATLVGCAIPLTEMEPDFLCMHYGFNSMSKSDKVPAIRNELERRQILTKDEWYHVDSGRLDFGLSRCGMLAVKGGPYAVNNIHTKEGVRTQYVFINQYGKRNYVYTNNGQISSWQD